MTPFAERISVLAKKNNGVITVRQLLDAAGYKKRGANVITNIRGQLEDANLQTSPDFASAGLDEPIEIDGGDVSPSSFQDSGEGAIPEWQVQLDQISKRLERNETVQVTVRDILGWFGNARRGTAIVSRISSALEEFELRTSPDFRDAYIDESVHFLTEGAETRDVSVAGPVPVGADEPLPSGAPSGAPPTGEDVAPAPLPVLVSGGVPSDAIFRVGNLPTANLANVAMAGDEKTNPHGNLICITIKDSLRKAMTLMRLHSVDQLPVFGVDGSGKKIVWTDVRGYVTWKHVCAYLLETANGSAPVDLGASDVRECMRKSVEVVDSSEDVLRAIPKVLEQGFVLVRDKQRKITGIVTAHDLSETLQSRMQPYLLIEEIENHLRKMLDGKVTKAEIFEYVANANSVKSVSDLTFGGYIRLLKVSAIWGRVGIDADQDEFLEILDFARRTRNDIMHFAPDPLAPTDIQSLRRLAHFLRELLERR